MSKIIVIGNLTQGGKIGQCSNGSEYLRTSIAESRAEGKTDYYSLVLFNPTEHAKLNFMKGARLQIIGDFEDYARIYNGEAKVERNIKVESYQVLARKKRDPEPVENAE